MVLDTLGENLRSTLQKIARATTIDSALIQEVVRDIQRALLRADVNVKLALTLTRKIEEKARSEKPPPGMSPREHIIRIVHDELVGILGTPRELPLKKQVLMLVGLYGQGKTTTCGKLARYFLKRGLSVGLVAADVHRPAAHDQLETIARTLGCPFFGDPSAYRSPSSSSEAVARRTAVGIAQRGVEELRKRVDVVIVDTAGRDRLDEDLIREMREVFEAVRPDEKILVVDAQIGQQAGPQAEAFHSAVGITGVIVTKLDGTAKGGGALSAVSVTQAPILFLGTGEKLDDFERFEPARFIGRLLGMGDIQTLLERAEETLGESAPSEEKAKALLAGKFTLLDLKDQMEALTKMGPLSRVLEMVPGMGGRLPRKELEETEKRLSRFKIILSSMTREELENPEIVRHSRIQRIARGAGVEPHDVRELLKYYETSLKTMKAFSSNRKAQKALLKKLQAEEPDEG